MMVINSRAASSIERVTEKNQYENWNWSTKMATLERSTVIDENRKHLITDSILPATQPSMAELKADVAELANKVKSYCLKQEFLFGEIHKSNGENRGITNSISSYGVTNSVSSPYNDSLMVSIRNNEVKLEKEKVAHKVFDEMPAIRILKQKGTIEEYYAEFSSLFGHTSLYESFDIGLFIWGLKPEIKEKLMFEPKTLKDAYCLAKVQEYTNDLMKRRNNPSLSPVMKLNDSSGVNKTIGSMVLDQVCKEDEIDNKMEPKDSNNVEDKNNELVVIDTLVKGELQTDETESFGYYSLECENSIKETTSNFMKESLSPRLLNFTGFKCANGIENNYNLMVLDASLQKDDKSAQNVHPDDFKIIVVEPLCETDPEVLARVKTGFVDFSTREAALAYNDELVLVEMVGLNADFESFGIYENFMVNGSFSKNKRIWYLSYHLTINETFEWKPGWQVSSIKMWNLYDSYVKPQRVKFDIWKWPTRKKILLQHSHWEDGGTRCCS